MLSRFIALSVSPILNASLLQLFNHSLYPSGGEGWVSKMGNISMTYYTNGFDSNNVHQKTHPMVNGGGGMEPQVQPLPLCLLSKKLKESGCTGTRTHR